jgi:hypothetical protein
VARTFAARSSGFPAEKLFEPNAGAAARRKEHQPLIRSNTCLGVADEWHKLKGRKCLNLVKLLTNLMRQPKLVSNFSSPEGEVGNLGYFPRPLAPILD